MTSCDYFNVKKTSPSAILNEELKTFNWDDIDQYPSFSACDTYTKKEDKKTCFQETLSSGITNYLERQFIVVTQDINDTLLLEFTLSKQGHLVLEKTVIDSLTLKQIPQIETLIFNSLDSLPKIYPAIKRGQQVTTTFKLPLIINVD